MARYYADPDGGLATHTMLERDVHEGYASNMTALLEDCKYLGEFATQSEGMEALRMVHEENDQGQLEFDRRSW